MPSSTKSPVGIEMPREAEMMQVGELLMRITGVLMHLKYVTEMFDGFPQS